jgi:hypothetical protein
MEKTVVGGKVAIALGIMCIVFVAGLGVTIASYTGIISSKDRTNQNYVSTHSHDNAEFNFLNASLNDANSAFDAYAASHQHTDQEFDSAVTAPRLATLDVTTENDWSNPPYVPNTFHVHGYVVNAGSDTAYNTKIHVVVNGLSDAELYAKVIDDNITLGTMDGGSWTTFDSTFVYSGGPVMDWTITPQWTTTP